MDSQDTHIFSLIHIEDHTLYYDEIFFEGVQRPSTSRAIRNPYKGMTHDDQSLMWPLDDFIQGVLDHEHLPTREVGPLYKRLFKITNQVLLSMQDYQNPPCSPEVFRVKFHSKFSTHNTFIGDSNMSNTIFKSIGDEVPSIKADLTMVHTIEGNDPNLKESDLSILLSHVEDICLGFLDESNKECQNCQVKGSCALARQVHLMTIKDQLKSSDQARIKTHNQREQLSKSRKKRDSTRKNLDAEWG